MDRGFPGRLRLPFVLPPPARQPKRYLMFHLAYRDYENIAPRTEPCAFRFLFRYGDSSAGCTRPAGTTGVPLREFPTGGAAAVNN